MQVMPGGSLKTIELLGPSSFDVAELLEAIQDDGHHVRRRHAVEIGPVPRLDCGL